MHWGPSSTENVNPNTVAAGSVKRPSQAMVSQLSSGHRISQDGLLQSATLGEWEKSQRIDPTAAQASWAYQISAVWAWELSARFSAFSSPDCPKYLLARGFLGTQIHAPTNRSIPSRLFIPFLLHNLESKASHRLSNRIHLKITCSLQLISRVFWRVTICRHWNA